MNLTGGFRIGILVDFWSAVNSGVATWMPALCKTNIFPENLCDDNLILTEVTFSKNNLKIFYWCSSIVIIKLRKKGFAMMIWCCWCHDVVHVTIVKLSPSIIKMSNFSQLNCMTEKGAPKWIRSRRKLHSSATTKFDWQCTFKGGISLFDIFNFDFTQCWRWMLCYDFFEKNIFIVFVMYYVLK